MQELKTENYKLVCHRECEFFPCHKGLKEEFFNCLFCYCPLYMLGDACGGNFQVSYGVKDCSDCTIPHSKGGYDYIMGKMGLVCERGSNFVKDQ